MGLVYFLDSWIETTLSAALMVVFTALAIYAVLLVLTRLSGLRSFSKMSGFDFAVTVAVGSLIATVIVSEDPPFLQGVIGLAVLFAMQYVVSAARAFAPAAQVIVDNDPILLMWEDRVLEENLEEARMTMDDLRAKLREANVLHYGQVRAVVMETTGDVSVLHSDADESELDPALLSNVRGAEDL